MKKTKNLYSKNNCKRTLINCGFKICNLIKYIFFIIASILSLIITVILSFEKTDIWPFVTLSIFILFLFNIDKFIQNFEIFKIGKDGVELKKITKDAQNTMDELKKLAILFSDNLSKLITRTGRIGSSFSIREFCEYRTKIIKLLSSFHVDEKEFKKSVELINNFILFDILMCIHKRYNGSSKVHHCKQIYQYISSPTSANFLPKINSIESYLKDKNELDEINQKILAEAKYFQKNKSFKTVNFINFIETKIDNNIKSKKTSE